MPNIVLSTSTQQTPAQTAGTGSPEIKVARASAPLQALTPGSVIEVTVRRDPQAGSGVLIKGEFVPAALPATLADGQKVLVRVVPGADAVILRLTNQAQLKGQNLVASSFEQILRTLLPDLKLSDLQRNIFASPPQLAELLGLAKSNLPAEQKTARAETPAQNAALTQIIERLFEKHAMVGDTTLRKPELLERALTAFLTPKSGEAIEEATQALQKLAGKGASPALVRLLQATQSHLQSLLETATPLDFEVTSSPEKLLSQQLKIYLLASQTAAESGDTKALTSLSRGMEAVRRLENPLVLLTKILFNLESQDLRATPENDPVLEVLKELRGELSKLKSSGAAEKEIRAVLSKMEQKLSRTLEEVLKERPDLALLKQVQQTVKAADNLAQVQQTLNQLNPIMHVLGEPALLFVPALLQGLFSPWRVSVRSPDEPDSEGQSGKGGGSGFTRVQLQLSFPSLGKLEVDIAHRKGEALLRLTSENEHAAALIEKKAPMLEKTLNELGYEKTSISAGHAKLEESLPSWFQELNSRSFIA